jgi:hypothetical protein
MDHPSSNLRLIRSPRAALISVTAFLAILATSIAPAAEEGDYKPPPGELYLMEGHLEWCAKAKTVAARIKRYESFWDFQGPKEEDMYDDGRHFRLVRRCAYRLAELYAQTGRTKECLKMLKFLEKADYSFDVNKTG